MAWPGSEPMRPRRPPGPPTGERRTLVVLALAVAIVLPLLMPQHFLPVPVWLVPVILGVLLIALLAVDPGRIDRHSVQAHYIRIGIVVILIANTGGATAFLTRDLIYGHGSITNSAPALMRVGAVVWVGLVIAFSFLYWELDLGGPGERAHNERKYPDLAFPEELSPEVRPPGWRPVFVDYLYLGLTNSLAFSPTDVMPLARWAKLTMGIQSIASFAIIGLVFARAVNIFK